jgi:cation diffusion facilitator family transporter
MNNISLQRLTVLIGATLLVGKFFAYYLTHSSTVLTDALESIINVVAGVLGLYSLMLSAQPKDENHPYGHGKVEFISAGVEGTLITIAGLVIIGQAIWSLALGGQAITQIDIGIYITAFAGAVNYGLGYMTEKQGHKTGSLALVAGGRHLKSDAYSTIGMVVGLLAIYLLINVWHQPYWAQIADNSVAIIFGLLIGWTGYGILRESVAGIMDEVDYPLVENMVELLQENRREDWIDVHNLRIIKYGPSLHIDCHLTLPWYYNTKEAHDEVDQLEDLLHASLDNAVELFVHVDPCVPTSCYLCQKKDCPERSTAFAKKVEWTAELIMRNKKHGLV